MGWPLNLRDLPRVLVLRRNTSLCRKNMSLHRENMSFQGS